MVSKPKVKYKINKKIMIFYTAALMMIVMIPSLFFSHLQPVKALSFEKMSGLINLIEHETFQGLDPIVKEVYDDYSKGVPDYLLYTELNHSKIMAFLENKNSMLAREPYYSTIIDVAKKNNINPILLFSIAGQEQGFVNRNNSYSKQIIKNPYNVYESWKKYSTSLRDSTNIAAQTINAVLEDRPRGEDPFKWLNNGYAADPLWWRGTKIIFQYMTRASDGI